MSFFKNSYTAVFLHFALLAIILLGGSYFGWLDINWNVIGVAPGDPSWYRNIATQGYEYKADAQSNVAFFPLFPLLWRTLNVNEYGISTVNILLLIAGILMLVKEYVLNIRETLLVCSTSGFFYCFLPFSEAVFFITSVMLLIGYKRDNLPILITGVVLASISRSAAVVFIPAVIVVQILSWQKKDIYTNLCRMLTMLAACVISMAIVAYIQYADTGEWFVFGSASKMWDKRFQFPDLPLKTWDNFKVLFYDTAALITGLIAGFALLYLLIRKFSGATFSNKSDYHFSLAYLAGMSLIALVYGVQGNDVTYINSLNRYIFCTAFFVVPVIYQMRQKVSSVQQILLVSTLCVIGCLMAGYAGTPYGTNLISARLDAVGILIIGLLFCFLKNNKWGQGVFIVIYFFQLALQIHFFQLYLKPNWVG